MPLTVTHNLSATTPDDPSYEIQPKHWNSGHAVTFNAVGSEIIGAFSNLNGISFGTEAGGGVTASYTVPVQSVQTQASGNLAGIGFTSTTTAGVDVKATQGTNGLSWANPAYITTARASTDAVGLNTALTANGVAWTVNSSGISLNVPAYLTTARRSTDAVGLNTAQTNVVWTVNSSGISIDAGGYLTTARASTDAVGLVTAQTNVTWTVNSAGLSFNAGGYAGTGFTSTTTAGTQVKATNNTAGLSMAVPAFLTTAQSVGAYLTTARASNDAIGLNTAQSNVTWSVDSSGLSFDARGYAGTGTSVTNASVTLNSNGLQISVAAPGGAGTGSFFEPFQLERDGTATSTGGIGTMHLIPIENPVALTFGQMNMIASASMKTTTAANTYQFSNTGASSHIFAASYSITNDNLVDLYVFSRGTGGFSTDMATFASTRNSFRTIQSHSYQASVSNGAGSTGSVSLKSTVSIMASFPMVTSGTVSTINAGSTVTTWGVGYSTWTASASTSTSNTYNTTATASISLAGTWPATTEWASFKMVPLNFGSSLSIGPYWLGINRGSNTSSSVSTAATSIAAGRTYSTTINASALTLTDQLTYIGGTHSIASSLGYMGQNTAATMAPSPGQGSFSVTFSPGSTYVNNAGQPNGEIAFNQINSNVSYFQHWFQLASNRL